MGRVTVVRGEETGDARGVSNGVVERSDTVLVLVDADHNCDLTVKALDSNGDGLRHGCSLCSRQQRGRVRSTSAALLEEEATAGAGRSAQIIRSSLDGGERRPESAGAQGAGESSRCNESR